MDKKDIQSKIDELVEWDKPVRLKKDAEIASNQKKIRRQLLDLGHDEEDVDRVLAEMLEDSRVIVDGVNITVPPKLKGVKREPRLCELGCGKIAVDQRIDIKFQSFPEKHWIKKCNFCQYYQLPDGRFARNSQQLYAELIKKKNKADK
jgi:hypothetical protein